MRHDFLASQEPIDDRFTRFFVRSAGLDSRGLRLVLVVEFQLERSGRDGSAAH
jgi:hypothetical protein